MTRPACEVSAARSSACRRVRRPITAAVSSRRRLGFPRRRWPAFSRPTIVTPTTCARFWHAWSMTGLFREVTPTVGLEMICGVGRIGGLWAGLIANNPELTDHPVLHGEKRPGGLLYREGIAKISQFSRCCNDDGIPIMWLHDISGFDIGLEAEKHGLLGLRLESHLHQLNEHRSHVHGAPAQSIRSRLLRHGGNALRSGRSTRHDHLPSRGDGRTHAGDRRFQHQARRQLRDRGRHRRRTGKDPQRHGRSRGAHHRRHGSGQGGMPDGHRRGRPLR